MMHARPAYFKKRFATWKLKRLDQLATPAKMSLGMNFQLYIITREVELDKLDFSRTMTQFAIYQNLFVTSRSSVGNHCEVRFERGPKIFA